MNIWSGIGRLTYNPELKSTQTGKSVLRFQVAIDRAYTPKGAERKADFIDCVAWDKTAEFVHRYFAKGSQIALTGELHTDNYTDKNGNMRKIIEVAVKTADFCGKKEETEPSLSIKKEDSEYKEEIIDDGGLPWE